jgi:hypothetical protein
MVDPEQGKLWVNGPNCILRIQGLKFQNIREKFSMIDINGSDAFMLEGDLSTSDIHDFIEKMCFIIINNNYSKEDMDFILDNAESISKGE